MVDLTNPSPLIMTHFELTGFVGGVVAVIFVIALDYWRGRSKTGSDPK